MNLNDIEARILDDSGENYYYLSDYEKDIIACWEKVKNYLRRNEGENNG